MTERKWTFWAGEVLGGERKLLAFDTETELAQDSEHPRLAIATASDHERDVVVFPQQFASFLYAHRHCSLVGHNFAFDFWVVDRFLTEQLQKYEWTAPGDLIRKVLEHWWALPEAGGVHDTMLSDMLYRLAKGEGENPFADNKNNLFEENLENLARVYLHGLSPLRVKKAEKVKAQKDMEAAGGSSYSGPDKQDPYRKRYAELLDLSEEQLRAADPGFYDYATADTRATYDVFMRLYPLSLELARRHIPAAGVKRFAVFPDVLMSYGVLTEKVQVLAAIALGAATKNGILVDEERARLLETEYRKNYDLLLARLEEEEKGFSQRYGPRVRKGVPGERILTPKALTSKKDSKVLRRVLQDIAEDEGIAIPISKGKQKLKSISAKDWSIYSDRDPFLKAWVELESTATALGFFGQFRKYTYHLHPRYTTIVRTGRVSSSKPNITQQPRAPEFRAMFVAHPGFVLGSFDHAYIELRTLAAVCEHSLGRSKLGEVIREGRDPHSYLASSLTGVPYEDIVYWAGLKKDDPLTSDTIHKEYKKHRQRSKAVGFGVPGGLGWKKLIEYARLMYKVELTEHEARTFREKLIYEIYPELSDRDGYLKDAGLANLAHGLGVTRLQALEVMIKAGCGGNTGMHLCCLSKVLSDNAVKADGQPYSPGWVDKLWRLAEALYNSSPRRDWTAGTCEAIQERQGSRELEASFFTGVALTLTGRVRSRVIYTQQKNTPFQSLAADGMKLALWRLVKEGFRLSAMVHDEVVVELPKETAEQDAERVVLIMKEEMEKVLRGVPAAVSYTLSDCWSH